MRKFIFTICLLLTQVFTSLGQGEYDRKLVRPEINRIASKIAKEASLDTEHVYYSGVTTKQFLRFKKLLKNAEVKELVALTGHKSPYVRVYSFWALAKREYPDVKQIILNHKDDKELIDTQQGCIGSTRDVVGTMLTIVTPNYWDLDCIKLSEQEIEQLYFNLYGKKVDLDLTPIKYEEVIADMKQEFAEMRERTARAKGTELKRFEGLGAMLDSNSNTLLIQKRHNIFELYDYLTFEKLDSFEIASSKEIRADLIYFSDSKVFLGTWKNFKKDKSVFWSFDRESREIEFMKCKDSPRGCIEGGESIYVYDFETYIYNQKKLKVENRNLILEDSSVVVYQVE